MILILLTECKENLAAKKSGFSGMLLTASQMMLDQRESSWAHILLLLDFDENTKNCNGFNLFWPYSDSIPQLRSRPLKKSRYFFFMLPGSYRPPDPPPCSPGEYTTWRKYIIWTVRSIIFWNAAQIWTVQSIIFWNKVHIWTKLSIFQLYSMYIWTVRSI